MKKNSAYKAVAAGAVALALSVTAFGGLAFAPTTAYARSDNSSISSASSEQLIRMLESLIDLLTKRLDALLAARGDDTSSNDDSTTCDDSDDVGLSELEATIFTNETVVKIELDGDNDVLVLDDSFNTEEEIVDAILDEYTSLSRDEVEAELTVTTEDRDSKASDKVVRDNDDDSCVNNNDDDDEDHDRGHGNDDDHDDDDNPGHGHGRHRGHGGGHDD